MERFEGYWGKKPQVREARFFYVSDDTTRASKLKAGEVDLILSCPYPMVKDFEKSPNFKLIKLDVNSPTKSVIFSTRNPKTPWHNKIVRQALAHAIDWKAINDNILYGIPNQLTYLAPWDLGYDPSLKPYIYDPQKAKELLAKAGYPNGFDLQLYYYIGRVYGDREMAQAVTGYFNAIGIRATPVEEEYIAGRARTSAAKKPDAVFVGLANAGLSGGLVVSKLRSFFHSQGANCVNSNPDLDKVIDEAISTFDDKKLVELIKKAQRIIYEDVPVIPISSYVAVYVAKKDVDYTPTKGYAFDLVFIKDVTFK